MPLTIQRATELPADVDRLVAASERERLRFVRRCVDAWTDGSNRFDDPGEGWFVATDDGTIGICGLNRDPYVDDPRCGRLRHLYVLPEARRRGVGAALVARVLAHAHDGPFTRLRLRTHDPRADAFYRALGWTPVRGDTATHLWIRPTHRTQTRP